MTMCEPGLADDHNDASPTPHIVKRGQFAEIVDSSAGNPEAKPAKRPRAR